MKFKPQVRPVTTLLEAPPRVFVLQTRGPKILRDLEILRALAQRTKLRVSFSITTNREEVRKLLQSDRLRDEMLRMIAGMTIGARTNRRPARTARPHSIRLVTVETTRTRVERPVIPPSPREPEPLSEQLRRDGTPAAKQAPKAAPEPEPRRDRFELIELD